jgi:hypothetical protein
MDKNAQANNQIEILVLRKKVLTTTLEIAQKDHDFRMADIEQQIASLTASVKAPAK